jgi:hypothetical protein
MLKQKLQYYKSLLHAIDQLNSSALGWARFGFYLNVRLSRNGTDRATQVCPEVEFLVTSE